MPDVVAGTSLGMRMSPQVSHFGPEFGRGPTGLEVRRAKEGVKSSYLYVVYFTRTPEGNTRVPSSVTPGRPSKCDLAQPRQARQKRQDRHR